jgi:hypothetical protein
MYRKKHSVSRVQYYLRLQAAFGGLGTHTLKVKGDCNISVGQVVITNSTSSGANYPELDQISQDKGAAHTRPPSLQTSAKNLAVPRAPLLLTKG